MNGHIRVFLLTILFVGLVPLHGMQEEDNFPQQTRLTNKVSTLINKINVFKEQINVFKEQINVFKEQINKEKNNDLELYLLETQKLTLYLLDQTNSKITDDIKTYCNIRKSINTLKDAIKEKDQLIFEWYLKNYASILTTPISIAYKQNKTLTAIAAALASLGIYTACKDPETVVKEGAEITGRVGASMAASGKELTQNLWDSTKKATTFISKKAKELFDYYWNKPATSTNTPTNTPT